MRPDLVTTASVYEFFKCLVDQALSHQRVEPLESTRFYLVQLLAGRARAEAAAGAAERSEPLALWFARAIDAGGSTQRQELRGLADHALFVSGFFSDTLARQVVDIDYYASLGGYAYQHLSALDSGALAPTFAELAERFLAFADVLTEVSEETGLTTDRDLLRLYERWVQVGGARQGERLRRMGILPTAQARQARLRVQ